MTRRAGAVGAGGLALLSAAAPLDAAFVRLLVTAIGVEDAGKQLAVYTVAPRFDGPSDVVIVAYQLSSARPESFKGFWHRDLATAPNDEAGAVLTQSANTWKPTPVGPIKTSSSCDSYTTIGGEANQCNTTIADPSWAKADGGTRGWSRLDLPWIGNTGRYVVAREPESSGCARKSKNYEINGKSTLKNPATDVRLAQFVRVPPSAHAVVTP